MSLCRRIYPDDFLTKEEISQIATLLGFSLSNSLIEQINQIRNRLEFSGCVPRTFFDDCEMTSLLKAFGIPVNGSIHEQYLKLKSEINKPHMIPYIPQTNPGASPIVVQISSDGPMLESYKSHDKPNNDICNLDYENNSKDEFNLEELRFISSNFGLPTYGSQDDLTSTIKAYIFSKL